MQVLRTSTTWEHNRRLDGAAAAVTQTNTWDHLTCALPAGVFTRSLHAHLSAAKTAYKKTLACNLSPMPTQTGRQMTRKCNFLWCVGQCRVAFRLLRDPEAKSTHSVGVYNPEPKREKKRDNDSRAGPSSGIVGCPFADTVPLGTLLTRRIGNVSCSTPAPRITQEGDSRTEAGCREQPCLLLQQPRTANFDSLLIVGASPQTLVRSADQNRFFLLIAGDYAVTQHLFSSGSKLLQGKTSLCRVLALSCDTDRNPADSGSLVGHSSAITRLAGREVFVLIAGGRGGSAHQLLCRSELFWRRKGRRREEAPLLTTLASMCRLWLSPRRSSTTTNRI